MSTTTQQGIFLGDLLGAHDLSDFVLQVENVSPTAPELLRGDVLARKGDGTVTLAGAELSTVADVYGILLDPEVPAATAGATCSVARSGVFDAQMLRVDPSITLKACEVRLRELNIMLEKLELVP